MTDDTDTAPQAATLPAGDFSGITLSALSAAFPHWRIFESNGHIWAMRAGQGVSGGPHSLILPVVSATTLASLAEQLSLQELFRRMTAEELETVWFRGLDAVAPTDTNDPDPDDADSEDESDPDDEARRAAVDQALDVLDMRWGDYYTTGHDPRLAYWGARSVITADNPEDLDKLLGADHEADRV